MVIVSRKGPQRSIRAGPIRLGRAIVVEFADIAIIRGISAILIAINTGVARQTGTSREVPLTISCKMVKKR
jgi:hypothetical protein